MKDFKMKKSGGFTLIELLVVISIIGLLSTVVMASLSSARDKGKDAAIRSEMIQFRNLLAIEYEDAGGSYLNLQTGWVNSIANCNTLFNPSSVNANVKQANSLCKAIYNNSADDPLGASFGRFFTGINTGLLPAGTLTYDKYYSMVAYLPGSKQWLCMGTSGISTSTWAMAGAVTPNWPLPGCWSNP